MANAINKGYWLTSVPLIGIIVTKGVPWLLQYILVGLTYRLCGSRPTKPTITLPSFAWEIMVNIAA